MKAIVVVMILCGVAVAGGEEHAKKAMELYRVGNFEAALGEYEKAYAEDPKPDYLYAMAAIEDQRGGCAKAIELYGKFLETQPPEEDVVAVQAAIDACKEKLGIVDEPEPEPEPEPVKPEPEPVKPPPPEPVVIETRSVHRVFWSDALGDALVGVGVVGLAGAGVFYGLARSDAEKASEPMSRAEYEATWERAKDRRVIAEVAAGVGVAAVVGGVLRWMTYDRWEVVPVGAGVAIASRW